jgi:hypothetical protein
MMSETSRSRLKKYNTRKTINVFIKLCQKLDEFGEEYEYNLTGLSSEYSDHIRKGFVGITCLPSIVLRVTRHVDKERFGPVYVAFVSEKAGFTYVPRCFVVTSGKSIATAVSEVIDYELPTTEIVDTISVKLLNILK